MTIDISSSSLVCSLHSWCWPDISLSPFILFIQAITVGATDIYDDRAYFSNYGPCVNIYAPGVAITSSSSASDTAIAVWSGTSMATPHVAGRCFIRKKLNLNCIIQQCIHSIWYIYYSNGVNEVWIVFVLQCVNYKKKKSRYSCKAVPNEYLIL